MLKAIQDDLFQAMKDKDSTKKNLLQIIRANATNLAKKKRIDESELTDEDVLGVIIKENKQQNDSLRAFTEGKREDLVSKTARNIEILSEYLPEQMSESDVDGLVKDILQKLSIDKPSNKDRGLIMKELMPLTKGKIDGKIVSNIVGKYIS